MHLFPDTETFTLWLSHYGSYLLFFMLTLGILALPVPEETLMVISGALMRNGTLNIPLTVIFAIAGCLCGITVSYILGRTAGKYLILKWGRWVGITEAHVNKAHQWFERFGKWLLFIGYFIPGIRHFTGLSAGMTYLKYKEFALFAYSGALVWVACFISIGYFLGDYWQALYDRLEDIDWITISIILAAIIVIYFIIKKRAKP